MSNSKFILERNLTLNIRKDVNSKMIKEDKWDIDSMSTLKNFMFDIMNSSFANANHLDNLEVKQYLHSKFSVNKIQRLSRYSKIEKAIPTGLVYRMPSCETSIPLNMFLLSLKGINNSSIQHNRTRYSKDLKPKIGEVSVIKTVPNIIKKRKPSSNEISIKFHELINKKPQFLDGIVNKNVDRRLDFIYTEIASLNPEIIELELTDEKSLYFSIKIGNKLLLIDYYLELEDKSQEIEGDDSEIIVSVFKEKIKIYENEGSFSQSILNLMDFLTN